MDSPSHRFEEHVGEVEVRLEAATLAGLLAEGGRALAEIMASGPVPAATGDPVPISLTAPDREALLVAWLNELIFRAETERSLFTEFRFDSVTDREVRGAIRGSPVAEVRSLVKAATFHGLAIRPTDEGLTATVVLDV